MIDKFSMNQEHSRPVSARTQLYEVLEGCRTVEQMVRALVAATFWVHHPPLKAQRLRSRTTQHMHGLHVHEDGPEGEDGKDPAQRVRWR